VTATTPITLGRAWEVVDRLVTSIARACPELQTIEPAGEIRRVEPLVASIVIAGQADAPAHALSTIASLFNPHLILERTDERLLVIHDHSTVDIRLTTPDRYGTTLFLSTGSDRHVEQVTALGLATDGFSTEALLYSSVGLELVPPELRHGEDEVAAARTGALPRLIDVRDVRGDLHMHTSYSDGRDTVAAMVEGCHALGYEYMAITDHSWGAMASRTLAADTITKQREEIELVRERFPHPTILHGVEVDILPDGDLDFADSILERFDIVLASLHDDAGQGGAQLTARTLGAIRHPLVNVVCHPANRLVGRWPGYDLDFDSIYAAAAETGTALEVDGAPSHIDLDGARARAAVRAGVTLTIDSDCHRVDALGRQMRFGVGTARRGWVEPQSVLNTRPLAAVREFIAAKRRGGR
jgi:DNA polymerase (family X)